MADLNRRRELLDEKSYQQSYERFFEDPDLTRINAEFVRGWAWQFKDFYGRAYRARNDHPANVIVVRHEDLLVEPIEHMARIYGFLTVANDEATVRSCVESNSFEKLSGGRRKGQEDNTPFVRKGVSGDWKNYFTAAASKPSKRPPETSAPKRGTRTTATGASRRGGLRGPCAPRRRTAARSRPRRALHGRTPGPSYRSRTDPLRNVPVPPTDPGPAPALGHPPRPAAVLQARTET